MATGSSRRVVALGYQVTSPTGGRLPPAGLALVASLQQPVAILILSKTSPMTTKTVCSGESRLDDVLLDGRLGSE